MVSGSAYAVWGMYAYFWKMRLKNPKYAIVAIVQTGPEKEALKTGFLAELLQLSTDSATYLYSFDLQAGERRLLACPIIKTAKIKRIPPCTLYVDYALRKPVAFLKDFTNTALGQDFMLMAFHPFFSPKKIPEIVLGISHEKWRWGDTLTHPSARLAMDLCADLIQYGYKVIRIDASKAYAESLGGQQLLAIVEAPGSHHPTTLIFNPKTCSQALESYAALQWHTPPELVDLRVHQLALIKERL
jgi:hypothetical protein